MFSIFAVTNSQKGFFETLNLNGTEVTMQIDTATDYSVTCKSVYERHFSNVPLKKSDVKLRTYTGDKFVCLWYLGVQS